VVGGQEEAKQQRGGSQYSPQQGVPDEPMT